LTISLHDHVLLELSHANIFEKASIEIIKLLHSNWINVEASNHCSFIEWAVEIDLMFPYHDLVIFPKSWLKSWINYNNSVFKIREFDAAFIHVWFSERRFITLLSWSFPCKVWSSFLKKLRIQSRQFVFVFFNFTIMKLMCSISWLYALSWLIWRIHTVYLHDLGELTGSIKWC
jgi:hypothetical protein